LWRNIGIGCCIRLALNVIGQKAIISLGFSLRLYFFLLKLEISLSKISLLYCYIVAESLFSLFFDNIYHVEDGCLKLVKLILADTGFREIGDKSGQYFAG
jgi:hypothetical protein